MNADSRTDGELVRAARAGDDAAFETLYRRYRDWAVRLAFRFTGDHDGALDVLQETFAYLLQRLPHLTLTARMTTFLYPVVKNLALSERRRRSRFAGDSQALDARAAPVPVARDGGREQLAEVVANLSDAHREVLLMRFVDDMTLAEIAGALGVPVGTVKSRLHNALRLLRDDPRTKRYFDR